MSKTEQRSLIRKVFESKADTVIDDIISKILNRHPELKKFRKYTDEDFYFTGGDIIITHEGKEAARDWLRIAIYRDLRNIGYNNNDEVNDAFLSGELTQNDIWDAEDYVVGFAFAACSVQEMLSSHSSWGEDGKDGMLDAIEGFIK